MTDHHFTAIVRVTYRDGISINHTVRDYLTAPTRAGAAFALPDYCRELATEWACEDPARMPADVAIQSVDWQD